MDSPEYVPGSALARELLSSFRFAPDNGGFLTVDGIIATTEATPDEIAAVIRDFEVAGLVINREASGIRPGTYAPQPKAWVARERLLAADGKRNPALVRQLDHRLSDLLLALLAHPGISNANMTGAFFGLSRSLSLAELETYLYAYPRQAIEAEAAFLVVQGLANAVAANRSNVETAYTITGLGTRRYRDEVAERLSLATDRSILDLVDDTDRRTHISVFEAWQSECKASRDILSAALIEVVLAINAEGKVSYPVQIVRATEPGDGAIRIDVALQERILSADFFVGDLTPVYAYGDRLRVNENVLVEVGFALASKEPDRVILVAKSDVKVPGDASKAKPAFDIAHVRRLNFKDLAGLRQSLRRELEAVLKAAGWLP